MYKSTLKKKKYRYNVSMQTKRKAEQDYLHMKNKKNDGKYVIIDDGTAGGCF